MIVGEWFGHLELSLPTGICDPADEVFDDEGGEAEGECVDGGVAHAEVGGHAGDVHRLDAGRGQGHVQA